MEEDEIILNKYGWTVVCYSPYEIEHEETGAEVKGHYPINLIVSALTKQEEERNIILDYLKKEIEIWEERN